jgi:hypothetical protein
MRNFQIPYNDIDDQDELNEEAVQNDPDEMTAETTQGGKNIFECRHCSGSGICKHNDGTCRSKHYDRYKQWPKSNHYECRYCNGLGIIRL